MFYTIRGNNESELTIDTKHWAAGELIMRGQGNEFETGVAQLQPARDTNPSVNS